MKYQKHEKDSGLKVTVRDGQFDKALRLFKKKVQKAGIVKECRQREHYVKPSVEKQEAKKEAVKRWRKQQKKLQTPNY
jgi:small subunit ribosomal protein S21